MWQKMSDSRYAPAGTGAALCVLLVMLALCACVEAAPVTVVSPTSLPSVVSDDEQMDVAAAEDLADYLSRVSGRTISVVSSPGPTGTIIHVGNDTFVQTNAPEVAGLFSDGFIIKYVYSGGRDHIILAGNLD